MKRKIKFLARPQDDPHKRKPDIGRAKKYLGWSPKVDTIYVIYYILILLIGFFERWSTKDN